MAKINFNKELDRLVCKYNIDKYNPSYRSYLKAIDLAKQTYSAVKESNKEFYLAGMDEIDVKAFMSAIDSKDSVKYKICEQIFQLERYSTVLFVSYYRRDEFIMRMLEQEIHVIDLYSVFEENGLIFQHSFYDIYHEHYYDYTERKWVYEYGDIDENRIYYYHRRRFELEKTGIRKKKYLEKMIFDCVYVKDFLTLKENIDRYIEEYKEDGVRYSLFYQEVDNLLKELKKKLENRDNRDCVVFWLDALEYGMDKEMPFLKGLDEKALVFDHMYTVTPYTSPTFITLLTGKKQIDDETYKISKIGKKEIFFLQELEKRGYEFQYYGKNLNYLIEQNILSSHFYRSDRYSITRLYWDSLCDIAEGDDRKSRFYILHEVSQTHNPFVSFGITGDDKYLSKESFVKGHIAQDKFEKQQLDSRKYVDRQLKFWSEILPEKMYKIYMSDHGVSILGRYHVIMKIQQENIQSYRCDQLISYTNFAPLILQLMDQNNIDEDEIGSEYVLIQEVSRYSKNLVLEVVLNREFYSCHPEIYLGFQGVITRYDMYMCLENGMEYYQKYNNDKQMVTDSRLEYLRGLISKKKVDYFKESKFRYTRILIEAERRREERTRDLRIRKWKIIKELFQQISSCEVLALRGGGYHTLNLLMPLEEQYRKKVNYIIDGNRQCMAGKMGIEVISLDEIRQKGVTTVIISTWQYLQSWEQELQKYKEIRIINIYKILEEKGIVCDREVCFEAFDEDDFELGLADA